MVVVSGSLIQPPSPSIMAYYPMKDKNELKLLSIPF